MGLIGHVLDLIGVGVFAVTGALKASEKRMDVFGVLLIATVTGIGGGTMRDLLLGAAPVFWIVQNEYLLVCAVAAIVVFLAFPRIAGSERWLLWADAFGLAIFCVGGTKTALASGATEVVAVLMGTMTACFGGVLRDVLCAEVPLVLRREVYATAAAAGALAYILLRTLEVPDASAVIAGVVIAFAVRGAGLIWKLSLPTSHRDGS
jgi:uncharacterized membrane protein YeiH